MTQIGTRKLNTASKAALCLSGDCYSYMYTKVCFAGLRFAFSE